MKTIQRFLILFTYIFIFIFYAVNPAYTYAATDACDPLACNCGFLSCLCTGDCSGGGGGCTSDSQCGGTNVCCSGQCVGAGQCGGGGGGGGGDPTCWNGAVNCPAGSTISLLQPVDVFCSGRWGYSKGMCTPIGTAQRQTDCCQYRADGSCSDPQYTTYNCCNAASETQCTTSYSNYTITDPNPSCAPNTEIARVALACYLTTNAKGNWVTICPIQLTCRKATTTCTCVPTCTPSKPSVPVLTAPANNSIISTKTVSLSWSNTSWGVGCPTNNTYKIYVGTAADNLGFAGTTVNTYGQFIGNDGQTYYWYVEASNGSLSSSSPVWSFTINVPPAVTTPWWQVKDGDVTASNGDILSKVAPTKYFNVDGTGGFPGVPVFSGQLTLTPGLLSSKNWSANTQTTVGRIFDYTYFKNLIPDTVTPTTNPALISTTGYVADGYEWFKITGDLSLNALDFGNRKVILFVDNGNLTLNGKINVNDGVGFFGVFVKGNILVKSTVTGSAALEGIYLSDGSFTSEAAATQLHIRGSVASYGGVTLQRDLLDDSTAAELFEYAPDQILLFPKKLAFRRTKWAEIAP